MIIEKPEVEKCSFIFDVKGNIPEYEINQKSRIPYGPICVEQFAPIINWLDENDIPYQVFNVRCEIRRNFSIDEYQQSVWLYADLIAIEISIASAPLFKLFWYS